MVSIELYELDDGVDNTEREIAIRDSAAAAYTGE